VLDLVGGHGEVAVDRRLPAAQRLEVQRGGHPETRRDGVPVFDDGLPAGEGELVHPAIDGAFAAQMRVRSSGILLPAARRADQPEHRCRGQARSASSCRA
jgi:hypothetical protein